MPAVVYVLWFLFVVQMVLLGLLLTGRLTRRKRSRHTSRHTYNVATKTKS